MRLTGYLKAEGVEGRPALWVRVNAGGGGRLEVKIFGPGRSSETFDWTKVSGAFDVPDEAAEILFGFRLAGSGTVWCDDLSVEVVGRLDVGAEPARPLDARGLDNLIAFTRLFGYIRHFHPSDEAANADWDQVAIAGVQAVEGCAAPAELAATLQTFFEPLAPSLHVITTGLQPET